MTQQLQSRLQDSGVLSVVVCAVLYDHIKPPVLCYDVMTYIKEVTVIWHSWGWDNVRASQRESAGESTVRVHPKTFLSIKTGIL